MKSFNYATFAIINLSKITTIALVENLK